jgi:hypothetical protein
MSFDLAINDEVKASAQFIKTCLNKLEDANQEYKNDSEPHFVAISKHIYVQCGKNYLTFINNYLVISDFLAKSILADDKKNAYFNASQDNTNNLLFITAQKNVWSIVKRILMLGFNMVILAFL